MDNWQLIEKLSNEKLVLTWLENVFCPSLEDRWIARKNDAEFAKISRRLDRKAFFRFCFCFGKGRRNYGNCVNFSKVPRRFWRTIGEVVRATWFKMSSTLRIVTSSCKLSVQVVSPRGRRALNGVQQLGNTPAQPRCTTQQTLHRTFFRLPFSGSLDRHLITIFVSHPVVPIQADFAPQHYQRWKLKLKKYEQCCQFCFEDYSSNRTRRYFINAGISRFKTAIDEN